MKGLGWKRAVADPCLFYQIDQDGVCCGVMSHHVDDLLLAMPSEQAEATWSQIEQKMKIKRGNPFTQDKWETYLGREWRRMGEDEQIKGGIEVRMKKGYFLQLLKSIGLDRCRAVSSPQWGKNESGPGGDERLQGEDVEAYRSAVGKLAWSLTTRPDISYQVKELARHLQQPTFEWFVRLKRVLRYLKGSLDDTFKMICLMEGDESYEEPEAFVDANWGDPEAEMRSTS